MKNEIHDIYTLSALFMQGVIGAEAEADLQTAGLVVEVEAAHTAAIKSAP